LTFRGFLIQCKQAKGDEFSNNIGAEQAPAEISAWLRSQKKNEKDGIE
jgi:hypothetical protein